MGTILPIFQSDGNFPDDNDWHKMWYNILLVIRIIPLSTFELMLSMPAEVDILRFCIRLSMPAMVISIG